MLADHQEAIGGASARIIYANLEAGDIELPWASIAGFVDVAVVMAVLVWLAHRHHRRRHDEPTGGRAAELAHVRRGHLAERKLLTGRPGPSRRLPVGPLRVQRKVYYIDS